MRRPLPRASICHICETLYPHHASIPRFVPLLQAGKTRTPRYPSRAVAAFHSSPMSRKTRTATNGPRSNHNQNGIDSAAPRQRERELDLAGVATAVDRVASAFVAQQDIPSEQTTLAALRACAENDVGRFLLDAESQPEANSAEAATTVSHLLELDANGRSRRGGAGSKAAAAASTTKRQGSSLRLQDVVDKMSAAAYTIVSHPPVVITPSVLATYVGVQARLGKPESLPRVLELYAAKPRPKTSSGPVERYVTPNPHRTAAAVDVAVAEAALTAAIEAKNLDAAVGIVENTYGTRAFVRAKTFQRGLMPAVALVAVPTAAYLAASRLSLLQHSMDPGTATGVVFAGLLAYTGFTLSIGLVATATANDQVRRVSWAPGTPLRQRFLREDERAAFDRVACSFGFSEQQRFGEEEGDEFQALREYMLRKGMILDAVELMEGMS